MTQRRNPAYSLLSRSLWHRWEEETPSSLHSSSHSLWSKLTRLFSFFVVKQQKHWRDCGAPAPCNTVLLHYSAPPPFRTPLCTLHRWNAFSSPLGAVKPFLLSLKKWELLSSPTPGIMTRGLTWGANTHIKKQKKAEEGNFSTAFNFWKEPMGFHSICSKMFKGRHGKFHPQHFAVQEKKKSRTLGANYSAVLDCDLRKSPSGLNLTGAEDSWQ